MRIRVLLADPEEMLLEAYRGFLSRQGFEVETASGGPECLAKLRSWKPDVLILEPDMHNGWGEKILDELAHHAGQDRASVLILTRNDPIAIEYPVCGYHVKPLSMANLVKSIHAAADCRSRSAKT